MLEGGLSGRRRSAVVALTLAVCIVAPAAPVGAQDHAGGVEPWVERTPYEMPFQTRSAWLEFMAGGGPPEDTVALAAAYPEEEFTGFVRGAIATVDRVAFRSDSLVLRGILVRPTGEGPFPAIVYARGGNREYGRLLFLDVMRMMAVARGGYVVLGFDYRGEGESEGTPELAAGDVDDVLAAVGALEHWRDADTTRLGLIGVSRGGLTAAWALTRTAAFDAVVFLAPDLDLEDTARRRPAMDSAVYALSVPGHAGDRAAALRGASPLHAVHRMEQAPLLVIHGAADARVHPGVSLEFSRLLLERDWRHRFLLLEGGSHDLISHAAEVRRAVDDWFARHVLRAAAALGPGAAKGDPGPTSIPPALPGARR